MVAVAIAARRSLAGALNDAFVDGIQKSLGKAFDQGNRRAQFMANVSNKIAPRVLQLLEACYVVEYQDCARYFVGAPGTERIDV